MSAKKIQSAEDLLVRAIRGKHPDGARALYDRYVASLYGTILRILADEPLSEAVLEETFIRIWFAFDGYNASKERLHSWMINIARRLAVTQLRCEACHLGQLNQEPEERYLEIVSKHDTERAFDRRSVNESLHFLRTEERQVIEMVYIHGFTRDEAAEQLGVSTGMVKTRLVLAMRRLRKYYKHPGSAINFPELNSRTIKRNWR